MLTPDYTQESPETEDLNSDALSGVMVSGSPDGEVSRIPAISPAHAEARRLVGQGRPMFPTTGKKPFLPGGFHVATTDLDQLDAWYQASGSTEVAMPTGPRTGVWALDVDAKSGGLESLQALEAEHSPLPETPRTKTASGGDHYFFKYPEDRIPKDGQPPRKPMIRNSAGAIAPGIDIRGEGGYVLMPGSVLPDGRAYVSENPDTPIAEAPEWLLDLVDAAARGTKDRAEPEKTPVGKRNDSLASHLGRFVRDGLSREALMVEARQWNNRLAHPLSDAELETTVASIHRYDPASLFLTLPLTDAGAGDRMEVYCEGRGAYIVGEGIMSFYRPEEGRYMDDLTMEAERVTLETARRTQIEVSKMPMDAPNRTAMMDYARSLESGRSRREMLAAYKSRVAVTSDYFDQETYIINTPEGPVRTTTGELLPKSQDHRFRMQTRAHFDPDALALPFAGDPILEEVITTAMEGDVEMIDALGELLGMALDGDPQEERMVFVVGPGGGSKGTIFGGAVHALGDYGVSSDHSTWTKDPRGSRGPREDITRLRKKRLIGISEIPPEAELDLAFIKAFTGRDEVAQRGVYARATVPFRASGVPFFLVNKMSKFDGEDTGFQRRFTVTPIPHAIPPGKRRPEYKSHLLNPETGGKALLTWMIAGAIRYHQKGRLIIPDRVTRATEATLESADPVKLFVKDRLTTTAEGRIPLASMWETFRDWQTNQAMDGNSLPWVEQPDFTNRLKTLGFEQGRSSSTRFWKGVDFRALEDDDASREP